MCKITRELSTLERPPLLVEAAVVGCAQYQRRRDLRRMLRVAIPPTARAALTKLIPIEAELETRRKNGASTYSFARHVDILVALMAEARSFRRAA